MKNKFLVKELMQELILSHYSYRLLLQVVTDNQSHILLSDNMDNGFSKMLNEFKEIGVANYGL